LCLPIAETLLYLVFKLQFWESSIKIFKARFGDYLIDLNAVPQALDEEMVLTF
jgi:hypothetical protein